MKLEYEVVPLHTKHRFTIARAGPTERCAVWLRLTEEDGPSGWGEADPSPYYGETADTVCAALEGYRRVLEMARDPLALQEIEAACLDDLGEVFFAKVENGKYKFYSRDDWKVPQGTIHPRDRVSRKTVSAK